MKASKKRNVKKALPGILGWSTETRQKEAKKAWKNFDPKTRARLVAVLRKNALNRAKQAKAERAAAN